MTIIKTDKKNIELWLQELQDENDGALIEYGEEFRPALVGVASRCALSDVLCYDYDRCIDVLMGQGMDYEDAAEYFSYNVEGAYVGDRTPLVLRRIPPDIEIPNVIEVICEAKENDDEAEVAD